MEMQNSREALPCKKEFLSSLGCLVDLHLHLDGALTPRIAAELAAMRGEDVPSFHTLENRLCAPEDCASLGDFLACFAYPCHLLSTKEAVATATARVLEEAHESGTMYAEVRFAPALLGECGMTVSEAVEAAIAGIERAPIPASLILCLMRGEDRERGNLETLQAAKDYLGRGVVALDLAGAEDVYKTEEYRAFFEEASRLGIPFTVHAGEASGPASVWDALSFGACRIGHGVKSVADPRLVLCLAERGISLEMCFTSNRLTGAVPRGTPYPLRALMSAGVRVTLNTDDPSVEKTNLRREFILAAEECSLTKEEVKTLLLNAANASFATDAQKELMKARIASEFERN